MDDITRPGQDPGNPPHDPGMTWRIDRLEPVPAPPPYAPPPAPQPLLPGPYPQAPAYGAPVGNPTHYMPPIQYAPPAPAPQPYLYAPQYQIAPAVYTPVPVAVPSGYAANPLIKDPTMAAVVEILAGLCGFLGVGHMLAGRVLPGLILMLGWMFIGLPLIWFVIPFMTLGLGFCLSVPLWLGVPITSALLLRSELIGQNPFRR